jgi:hypothetical protein
MTRVLDLIRYGLILVATAYATFLIWRWHWLAALVACFPVYLIMLNLFGFLTLPLYALTPESRRIRRQFKGFEKSDQK